MQAALDGIQISGLAPVVRDFESLFAKFCEVPHCVAVANGTAALHAALLALDVKPGDEVIAPNSTIISNALAVTLTGATPVFVDVSEGDWCLDVTQIERAITPRTVGIQAVHLFGKACDMDALAALASKHSLWLLEDAAQAQGATWQGKKLGSLGDIGTFSFYANKLITTGEGGAVVTKDAALKDKLCVIRNLGFNSDPSRRFIHETLSHNYRLSGLQAAMGVAQVEAVSDLVSRRQKVFAMYQDCFGEPDGFALQTCDPRCTPAFWMMAVRLAPDAKTTVPELTEKLAAKGIETRRLFYPLHRQPVLEQYHSQKEDLFPVSDLLFKTGIYLPSASSLSWAEVQYVVAAFRECLL